MGLGEAEGCHGRVRGLLYGQYGPLREHRNQLVRHQLGDVQASRELRRAVQGRGNREQGLYDRIDLRVQRVVPEERGGTGRRRHGNGPDQELDRVEHRGREPGVLRCGMAKQGVHGHPRDLEHRRGNLQEGRAGGEQPNQVAAGGRAAKLAGPIANARHVQSRTRRRRGSSPLLRTALVLALVITLAFGAARLVASTGTVAAIAGNLKLAPSPALVASQLSVSGLEAGACMSLPQTQAGSGQTVFIDPGHGGLDPGVVGMVSGQQVLEKDAALAVAARLSDLLRADGYRVVMARTRDSTVIKLSTADSVLGSLTASAEHRDLAARAACANAAGAAALLSIHFDAFGDPSIGGTETFYDSARTFAVESHRLAVNVQATLVSALRTSDRRVWTDDQPAAPTLTSPGSTYGHLIELGPMSAGWVDDPSQMPGALVEPLFLTNPAEARLASDPSGQQKIAVALEAGLVTFLTGR